MNVLGRRLSKSEDIISNMLSRVSNPYLALSFGKDSLVMLDLVRKQKSDIKCLFLKSEESYMMYNYEDVIEQYLNDGLNLKIVETTRLTDNNCDWNAARKKGNRDFYLKEFTDGWDGVFMGLRIEESKGRKMTLLKKENNVIHDKIMEYKTGVRSGVLRCCPMAYWTSFEVMLYLKQNNLPYLDVYNKGDNVRTTARMTGDAARNHSLFWIKDNNPEMFNKMIKKIPELRFFI